MMPSAASFIVQYGVWISWIVVSSIMTIYGLAFYIFQYRPDLFQLLFSYGKALQNTNVKNTRMYIDVPKRWFSHFYIFACIYHTGIALCVCKVYFLNSTPPLYLQILMKYFLNSGRPPTAIPEAVIIALTLVLLQVYRRCYECHFISVFSDSKMNIIHYIIGYLFYFGVGLSLLSEAPGFTKPGGLRDIVFKQQWLQWNHIIGVILFLWAWNNQFKSHKILAGLRKDSHGKVVTLKHATPKGYRNITWWLLCTWVVSSHIAMAFSSHDWYKQKFPSYTACRKGLIPYVL